MNRIHAFQVNLESLFLRTDRIEVCIRIKYCEIIIQIKKVVNILIFQKQKVTTLSDNIASILGKEHNPASLNYNIHRLHVLIS